MKNTTGLRRIGLAGLLLLAACGQKPAANNGANASSEPANGGTNLTANSGMNAVAPASTEGALSKYVGKHPSEAVDGTRFLDEPTVKAAVAAQVSDAKVRDFIFHYNGPDAPIAVKDGKILAWGCERHNCGYHNWSVAIAPDGGNAEICFYHDDDRPDGASTWYLADGKTEKRAGNCPSD